MCVEQLSERMGVPGQSSASEEVFAQCCAPKVGELGAARQSRKDVRPLVEDPVRKLALAFLACVLACATLPAAEKLPPSLWKRKSGVDWPQMLGPVRDGKSPEKGILTKWPAKGPKIVWTRPLGTGYSVGSVAYGRFYQFDRDHDTDKATLVCLNAETGEKLWDFAYPSVYKDAYQYNDGPPAADGVTVSPMDGDSAGTSAVFTDASSFGRAFVEMPKSANARVDFIYDDDASAGAGKFFVDDIYIYGY